MKNKNYLLYKGITAQIENNMDSNAIILTFQINDINIKLESSTLDSGLVIDIFKEQIDLYQKYPKSSKIMEYDIYKLNEIEKEFLLEINNSMQQFRKATDMINKEYDRLNRIFNSYDRSSDTKKDT